jgi:4-amino-4-deoxy-L-arabinose transferase-like glycosyltransferase
VSPGGRRLAWLVLGLDAVLLAWLALDHTAAPHDDAAAHLRNALLAYQALVPPRPASLPTLLHCYRTYPYPPLVYVLAALPMAVFGVQARVCALVNLVFYDLGLWAVWRLGRKLWGEPAGLLAAGLMAADVMLLHQCQQFYVDAAVFGLAALLLLAAVESDGGRRGGWTVAAGAAVGLGMLAKWSFLLLAVGPLAMMLASRPRGGPEGAAARRNLVRAALAAMILTVPWYCANLPLLVAFSRQTLALAPTELNVPVWQPASLAFYAVDLCRHQFGLLLALPCWLGAAAARRREPDAGRRLVKVYFLTSYVLLTLIRVKSARYGPPLDFVPALWGAAWLAGRSRSRAWLAAAWVLAAVNLAAGLGGPPNAVPWRLELWPGGPALLTTNRFVPAPWEPSLERAAAIAVGRAQAWRAPARAVIIGPQSTWGWTAMGAAYYLDRAQTVAAGHRWPPPQWLTPAFDGHWETHPPLSLCDDERNRLILVQEHPNLAPFIAGLRARADWPEVGRVVLPDGTALAIHEHGDWSSGP